MELLARHEEKYIIENTCVPEKSEILWTCSNEVYYNMHVGHDKHGDQMFFFIGSSENCLKDTKIHKL